MANSKYSTTAGVPTRGDAYAKLMFHIREAQDQAAVLAHLHNTEGLRDQTLAAGWLKVSEMLRRFVDVVIQIAQKGTMQ